MHGNVYQYCLDWFSADYYKQSPPRDPSGPTAGSNRVTRGSFWAYPASSCCSAVRAYSEHVYRNHGAGFRVVVDVAPKEQ
jgi:formylglycine-generating enzyme required for sulfatase activity